MRLRHRLTTPPVLSTHRRWLVAALTCLLAAAPALAQPGTIRVHENHLRTKALSSILPKFPAKARKAKASGVAVGRITIDESGRVVAVEILESPHPAIEEEVKRALFQWRFTPFTVKGIARRTIGKLTFYFVNDKQGARVENPHPW